MKKWIIILVALLAFCGIAAYFLLKNDSGSGPSATTDTLQQNVQPGTESLAALLEKNTSLSSLNSAISSLGLADSLDGTTQFTILAPTNDAFKALPTGSLERLLKADAKDQLKNVVNYHIIPGVYNASQFTNGQRLKSLTGQEITVSIVDKNIWFVDAKGGKAVIKKADISGTNGTIHTISGVLLPQ